MSAFCHKSLLLDIIWFHLSIVSAGVKRYYFYLFSFSCILFIVYECIEWVGNRLSIHVVDIMSSMFLVFLINLISWLSMSAYWHLYSIIIDMLSIWCYGVIYLSYIICIFLYYYNILSIIYICIDILLLCCYRYYNNSSYYAVKSIIEMLSLCNRYACVKVLSIET